MSGRRKWKSSGSTGSTVPPSFHTEEKTEPHFLLTFPSCGSVFYCVDKGWWVTVGSNRSQKQTLFRSNLTGTKMIERNEITFVFRTLVRTVERSATGAERGEKVPKTLSNMIGHVFLYLFTDHYLIAFLGTFSKIPRPALAAKAQSFPFRSKHFHQQNCSQMERHIRLSVFPFPLHLYGNLLMGSGGAIRRGRGKGSRTEGGTHSLQ